MALGFGDGLLGGLSFTGGFVAVETGLVTVVTGVGVISAGAGAGAGAGAVIIASVGIFDGSSIGIIG